MLLNLITKDGRNPVDKPPEAFTKIINHKIVNRVKQELDTLLSLDDYIYDISLKFVASLQSSDFIIPESDKLGKLSIFFLGMSKSSIATKDISL